MNPTEADLRAAADRRARIADALQYRMVHVLGWEGVSVTLDPETGHHTAIGTINGETFEYTSITPYGAVYGLYLRALQVAEEGR